MNVLNGSAVAQLAHVGWGALITFTIGLLTGSLFWAVVAGLVVAIPKEVMEAMGWAFWEPKQDWTGSLIDMFWYLPGIGWAAFVLWIH